MRGESKRPAARVILALRECYWGGCGDDTLNGDAGPDDVRDNKGADAFNGGAGIDEVDARDSGGQPVGTTADTITCAGGDEVLADRNDVIVNPAACGEIEIG